MLLATAATMAAWEGEIVPNNQRREHGDEVVDGYLGLRIMQATLALQGGSIPLNSTLNSMSVA